MSEESDVKILGVSFPKTISVGVLVVALLQGGSFVWQASKYSSSMDMLGEKIEQTNAEISKIKADIYTRSEAAIQAESFRRELDIQSKTIEKIESEIKDIRRGK